MELTKYERYSLEKIEKWEKEKHKGLQKKILDFTSKSVDYVMEKIGAEKFKKFENAIGAAVNKLLYASTYTVDPERLIKRAHDHGIMIKDIAELKTCNLWLLDKCNRKQINFHEWAATIQGAVAGIGGAITAPADLTAIFIQDFHMIQEICVCYGFDPNDLMEKEIILKIIEIALGSSEIKIRGLNEIERLKKIKNMEDKTETTKEKVSIVGSKALGESIEKIAVALLVRLLPRALPVISIVVSAHSDREIMENSGETAFMVCRKRFIERKKEM